MNELIRIWTQRPAWIDHAACLGMGPELFFPERGDHATQAAAVCAACPVRNECADEGRNERFGVWGGTSGRPFDAARLQRTRREAC